MVVDDVDEEDSAVDDLLPSEGKSDLSSKEGKSEVWKPGGDDVELCLVIPGSAAGAMELRT